MTELILNQAPVSNPPTTSEYSAASPLSPSQTPTLLYD
jgi:hypothetical protein